MIVGDHPEVVWIMRTGYPSFAQPKEPYCEECGKDLSHEISYEDNYHEYLCKRCLLNLHERI